MKRKHQPYRRNDGFWSCGVCKWQWDTRPSRDDCPGILRIAHSTEQYKTAAQWRKLGFEPVDLEDADATSHGHSSKWHYYYHRDHVRGLTPRAADGACTCDVLSVMGGVMLGYKKDCPVPSHAANARRWLFAPRSKTRRKLVV